jgi:hypothetical protein
MLRKIVFLLTAVSFLLIGIAAFTTAAENPTTTQPSTTVQPSISVKPNVLTQPVFFCPSGWQRKPNTTDFACVPNPPTGQFCATLAGEYYLPLSSCQFLHGKCMGCLVACEKGNLIHAPMPCPSGWHMKPYPACQNCSVCVPNSPTPINCPAGYNYYEMLECKPGIGTQCVGCEVGCAKPQAPPK